MESENQQDDIRALIHAIHEDRVAARQKEKREG
jgi:hypothetical protein